MKKSPTTYIYDYDHVSDTVIATEITICQNISQTNFNQTNLMYDNSSNLKLHTNSLFSDTPTDVFTESIFKKLKNETLVFENQNDPVTNVSDKLFDKQNVFSDYEYFRQSSFISFFINNFIDVPICFKKSKSLKNKNFELFFLKFSNLVMRQGKKEKTFRAILFSFFAFFEDLKKNTIKNEIGPLGWFHLLFLSNNLMQNPGQFLLQRSEEDVSNEDASKLFYNNFFLFENKEFDFTYFIKNFISSRLLQITPIFTYFIYNVDKNIRKYTRGKSGKYTFVWKYVAPYKRRYLMFRWFLKEVRFDESRKFGTRLQNMFKNLTFNINNTFAAHSKNYTYGFIFKNFRKSFMTTLKTTVK